MPGFRSAAVIVLVCAACSAPLQSEPERASFSSREDELVTDANSGGAPGFYFLAPLFKHPKVTGPFDATQQPTVSIDDTTSSTHVGTWTRSGGPDSERIVVFAPDRDGDDDDDCDRPSDRGRYRLLWRTDHFNLTDAHIYRITISLAGRTLGSADVEIFSKRKTARLIDRNEDFPLRDGREFRIRFFLNPCAPVVCTADQCHTAGVCAPKTAKCSAPTNKANGTTCNDGNACTLGDVCTAGVCGGAPKTCTASDQCHVAGVCGSGGACSNPNAPDNTACTLSTGAGVCQAGACAPAPLQGGGCTSWTGFTCEKRCSGTQIPLPGGADAPYLLSLGTNEACEAYCSTLQGATCSTMYATWAYGGGQCSCWSGKQEDDWPQWYDMCSATCNASCAPGKRDGGDGNCVPVDTCSSGYREGGDARCVPLGTCASTYHDGGDGACIALGQCATGYSLSGTACTPSTCPGGSCSDCGPAGAPGSCTAPAASCKALFDADSTTPSGLYWLQPAGVTAPFRVQCDMDKDGGGWTLVSNFPPIPSGGGVPGWNSGNQIGTSFTDLTQPFKLSDAVLNQVKTAVYRVHGTATYCSGGEPEAHVLCNLDETLYFAASCSYSSGVRNPHCGEAYTDAALSQHEPTGATDTSACDWHWGLASGICSTTGASALSNEICTSHQGDQQYVGTLDFSFVHSFSGFPGDDPNIQIWVR